MYPIRQVDRLLAEDIEHLGTKRKFWFTMDGRRYLFKAEERGTGEDWAEKVVSELAQLLGIPHVDYELAHEYKGAMAIQPGVICPTFVPRPLVLVLGNQLLFFRDKSYPGQGGRNYGVREYTVDAVTQITSILEPPAQEWLAGVPSEVTTALGVFIGYMMLDAWVANQDRHHQNWGAIWHEPHLRLAPTFDHGASLARNLTDEERKERLTTRDRNRSVERFACRARSGFYASPHDGKTLLALDAFRQFAERDPDAARIWLGKLAGISQVAVDAILAEIPPQRMSPVTREFTLKLLMINQRRLLDTIAP
ncbi:MAG: hypothetical protein KIT22_08770 [Verrucomicrobiae bacterium]|nr:hypothetical protein [Verrucomicrobiae bacterium]